MDNEIKILGQLLHDEFEVEKNQDMDDKSVLLEAIRQRVSYLLDREPGLLFSYLYRLDVSEDKVGSIVSGINREDPSLAVAQLIYDRQMQRMKTKIAYRQVPLEGWQW